MRAHDDKLYLAHILQCIEEIDGHLGGRGKEGYLTNKTIKAAVERTLHVMFESTQRLSPALKEKYSAMPWHEMAAIRHKLVHGYLGEVDDEAVWEVIARHLPEIKLSFLKIQKEQP